MIEDTSSSTTEQLDPVAESSPELDTENVDPVDVSSSDIASLDTTDTTSEVTGFSRWVLNSSTWLCFLVYCLVTILTNWYTQTTGKTSETLTNWLNTLDERLTVKQRKLFRLLSKGWERLCNRK